MLSFTPFRSPAEVQQVDLLQRSLWDLTPYYFLDCRTNNITCFLAQYVAPISDNKGDFLEVLKMSIYFIEDWMADWYIRLLVSDQETEFYEVCLPEIDFSFSCGLQGTYGIYRECCAKFTVLFPAVCEEKSLITPAFHYSRSLLHKRKKKGSKSMLTLEIRTGWHSYNFLWGSCQEHELDIRSVSDKLISQNKHISQNTRAGQLCSG